MADDTLKLRVDVETAPMGALAEEAKRLDSELKKIYAQLSSPDISTEEFKKLASAYAEGRENLIQVKTSFMEWRDVLEQGNGNMRELIDAVVTGTGAQKMYAERTQELIAVINNERSTVDEITAAWQELRAIRHATVGVGDAITGKETEIANAISKGKDIAEAARKAELSSSARLKESYFTIGEALRRLAAEQGGYVTKTQIEAETQQLATQENLSHADALRIVEESMKKVGVQQQSLTNFIREERAENRSRNFLLRESKESLLALAIASSSLTSSMGEQNNTVRSLGISLSAGIGIFTGLDFAAKALSVSLGLTQTAFLGIATGVGAIVAAGVGLTTFFVQSSKDAEAAAEKYHVLGVDIIELKRRLGLISEEHYLEELTKEVDTARAKFEELSKKSAVTTYVPGATERSRAITVTEFQTKGSPQEIAEAEKKLLDLEAKLKEASKDRGKAGAEASEAFRSGLDDQRQAEEDAAKAKDDLNKKQAEKEAAYLKDLAALRELEAQQSVILTQTTTQKQVSELDKRHRETVNKLIELRNRQSALQNPALQKEIDEAILAEIQDFADKRAKILTQTQPASVVIPPPKPPGVGQGEVAAETLEKWSPAVNILANAFDRLGQTIENEFIEKVIGANSLFQQFVGSVVSGIAQIIEQIAASAAISGLLSLLGLGPFGSFFSQLSPVKFASGGTITEPVTGVGLHTGRSYMIGENGPEDVVPRTGARSPMTEDRMASLMQSPASMGQVHITGSVEVRQRGRDLYGAVKINRVMDIKRGGRG